jgi:hypothetical protein
LICNLHGLSPFPDGSEGGENKLDVKGGRWGRRDGERREASIGGRAEHRFLAIGICQQEPENPSIGVKELGVWRKERPAKARRGEIGAGGGEGLRVSIVESIKIRRGSSVDEKWICAVCLGGS